MAIEGGGLVGSIKAAARTPPAPQASSSELSGEVDPGEFAGSTALVVGGSRGLGEVTAKLLAAGGAQVIITYRVGSAEAEAVAQDIRAAGGRCETLAYDAAVSGRGAIGWSQPRADACLLLRHAEDLPRAIGFV